MPDVHIDEERLQDKIKLFLKVNYITSVLSLIFALACYYFLRITHIIPFALAGFGLFNLANILVFKKVDNVTISYHISSFLALSSAFIITLYSGGINSSFIFMLALIAFGGYVTTRKYGRIYLNLIFLLVLLIFSQSFPQWRFTGNVIPEDSRDIFNFLSIILSIYILGSIFGRNLLKTHNDLYKSKKLLTTQMHEKETLIKEVHHRVKNNLQTVSSLLSLQSRSSIDPQFKGLLKSTQNRVIAMAMVHEMLYMRKDISHIEYKSYVQELGEYLIRSVKGIDNNVKLKIDIPDIQLGIDTAIPLGLLINEAITNSLKYGITDENEGEIYIILEKEKERNYTLKIGDNGIGIPDSINHKNTKSLGLKLIYNLTRQLKGTIERDTSKKGTNYIIMFQEIKEQLSPVA